MARDSGSSSSPLRHKSQIPTPESRPLPGSFLTSGLLLLPIQLDDVDALRLFTKQPPAEVIGPHPEEIILLRLVAMPQAGQDEEIESFVRLDERVGHPQR